MFPSSLKPDQARRTYERRGRRFDLLLFLRKIGELREKDIKFAAQLGDKDCVLIFPNEKQIGMKEGIRRFEKKEILEFLIYVCEAISPIYIKSEYSKTSKFPSEILSNLKHYLLNNKKYTQEINLNYWKFKEEGWEYEDQAIINKKKWIFWDNKKSKDYSDLHNIIEIFFSIKLILDRSVKDAPGIIVDVLDRIDKINGERAGKKIFFGWLLQQQQ